MKILLAVDGSIFSETAVNEVTSHFRPDNVEVLVAEVVEPLVFSVPPQMAAGYAPEQMERLKDEVHNATETVAKTAEVLRTAGFKADGRVVESEIRTGILDLADEYHPDLIVLGSHGRKGVEKFLLGSIAESVARHARCSVYIVRSAAKPAAASHAA